MPTYHVADLKFSMGMRVLEQKGLKKVWAEKYRAWRDFRKMLERASSEFEAHGRLRFTFDALRQGRAIQQVRFHLSLVGGYEPGPSATGQGRPPPPAAVAAADALRTLGYVGDAEVFVAQHGHEPVHRALKLGRAAEARGSGSGRPSTNLPGFVRHLMLSGAASRSFRLDAAGAKKPKRAAERDLVEMVKNAYDAFRGETAEEPFKTLGEDTRRALLEMMRVEFETRSRAYLAEVLERAGWQEMQYEPARNTYLLELYRDELSESAHDVGQFVAERDLLSAQPAEVAKRVLGALQDELRA